MLNRIICLMLVVVLGGCARGDISEYIQSTHPYVRKVTGDYKEILQQVGDSLIAEGWMIEDQMSPSVYERRSGGEDQSQDVLFITQSKRHFKLFYSSYEHLNVFVHQTAEGAEIDLRYEAITPLGVGSRNDALAKRILDRIDAQTRNK